ncbi:MULTISPECIES: toluene-4-monooxygenase system B family protein [unclassified Mycobacterium]|uniref:toluene-4-monooxygenase system B family protein n=1 Tax=unclassified Mycobacterium TaxID=2642494 RepID=UPI0029C95DC0|nr:MULTISPECIES: toluene-4-monooxygenase system B family protein [unclassified Mycobacterium]
MAPFPITGRFVGDFVPHLVAIDTDDTWDQVAVKVAVHSVGRRVAEPDPHPGYDVLLDDQVLPADATLGELCGSREILPLQWFDVRFRQGAPSNV